MSPTSSLLLVFVGGCWCGVGTALGKCAESVAVEVVVCQLLDASRYDGRVE